MQIYKRYKRCYENSNLGEHYLGFRGIFTGDLNSQNILPGCYTIGEADTVQNGPGIGYCSFIQLENYHAQLIIKGKIISRYYAGTPATWSNWLSGLTNADYEVQTITNSYGLNIHMIRFGNDNVKVIRLSGYINKALTAGTEYTIATNAILKSRVNWYHNAFVSGKGSELTVYLRIDGDGNIKITPGTAIDSGTAINMMEYYV